MDDITTLEYIIASSTLEHPEILETKDPRDLFGIPGFGDQFRERMSPDHDTTYNHAAIALARVKEKFPQKKYIFRVVGERVEE